MAMTVRVDIVSAEQFIFSDLVEFVVVPAQMGEVGIYPGHAAFLSKIKPGAVRLKLPNQNQEELIYVSGGILEVQPDLITILSDTAIRGDNLDEARAVEAKNKAEQALKDRSGVLDVAKAQAELAEAVAQIAAIRKLRQKH